MKVSNKDSLVRKLSMKRLGYGNLLDSRDLSTYLPERTYLLRKSQQQPKKSSPKSLKNALQSHKNVWLLLGPSVDCPKTDSKVLLELSCFSRAICPCKAEVSTINFKISFLQGWMYPHTTYWNVSEMTLQYSQFCELWTRNVILIRLNLKNIGRELNPYRREILHQ